MIRVLLGTQSELFDLQMVPFRNIGRLISREPSFLSVSDIWDWSSGKKGVRCSRTSLFFRIPRAFLAMGEYCHGWLDSLESIPGGGSLDCPPFSPSRHCPVPQFPPQYDDTTWASMAWYSTPPTPRSFPSGRFPGTVLCVITVSSSGNTVINCPMAPRAL